MKLLEKNHTLLRPTCSHYTPYLWGTTEKCELLTCTDQWKGRLPHAISSAGELSKAQKQTSRWTLYSTGRSEAVMSFSAVHHSTTKQKKGETLHCKRKTTQSCMHILILILIWRDISVQTQNPTIEIYIVPAAHEGGGSFHAPDELHLSSAVPLSL